EMTMMESGASVGSAGLMTAAFTMKTMVAGFTGNGSARRCDGGTDDSDFQTAGRQDFFHDSSFVALVSLETALCGRAHCSPVSKDEGIFSAGYGRKISTVPGIEIFPPVCGIGLAKDRTHQIEFRLVG